MDLQLVPGAPSDRDTGGHETDRLTEAEGLVRRTRHRLEEIADRLAELRRGLGQPSSRPDREEDAPGRPAS
jgi:hypothetical protein